MNSISINGTDMRVIGMSPDNEAVLAYEDYEQLALDEIMRRIVLAQESVKSGQPIPDECFFTPFTITLKLRQDHKGVSFWHEAKMRPIIHNIMTEFLINQHSLNLDILYQETGRRSVMSNFEPATHYDPVAKVQLNAQNPTTVVVQKGLGGQSSGSFTVTLNPVVQTPTTLSVASQNAPVKPVPQLPDGLAQLDWNLPVQK